MTQHVFAHTVYCTVHVHSGHMAACELRLRSRCATQAWSELPEQVLARRLRYKKVQFILLPKPNIDWGNNGVNISPFHTQTEKLGSLVTGASCLSPRSLAITKRAYTHNAVTKTPTSPVSELYVHSVRVQWLVDFCQPLQLFSNK